MVGVVLGQTGTWPVLAPRICPHLPSPPATHVPEPGHERSPLGDPEAGGPSRGSACSRLSSGLCPVGLLSRRSVAGFCFISGVKVAALDDVASGIDCTAGNEPALCACSKGKWSHHARDPGGQRGLGDGKSPVAALQTRKYFRRHTVSELRPKGCRPHPSGAPEGHVTPWWGVQSLCLCLTSCLSLLSPSLCLCLCPSPLPLPSVSFPLTDSWSPDFSPVPPPQLRAPRSLLRPAARGRFPPGPDSGPERPHWSPIWTQNPDPGEEVALGGAGPPAPGFRGICPLAHWGPEPMCPEAWGRCPSCCECGHLLKPNTE